METLTPNVGLIFWQMVIFSGLLLFLISWIMILVTSRLDGINKLIWLLGTLFLPVIGPLLFFFRYSSFKKPTNSQA
ncbi:PLDc N-terminal domain-containing protein [Pontibacter sp. BT310]|uniref:PLDc N-terminal domain-containing protein n=1 Tax=Pontibacter populi TaxID=890055 RepID=A0ABS6X921_9BACT|nr:MULTISPECIES: PLDc N-terminal domain-containing protein [Pontibacter]MBJ6117311.1 PLDc N-terminal domain-containing protein [Pontibacter sp. BT310]MBR0569736.1 PLDc N-terminal domain-containing protein [Microvirga sp. STS03]MBW3364164.1 PLDc N-terminal domain-containing protein [Pontibacter populi]